MSGDSEPNVEAAAMVSLPAYQAQQILEFLGECPAKHVMHLIGFLMAAQNPNTNGGTPGG